MNDIILKNICRSFGEKSVLKNFSSAFSAGSITCIMGPSGCGKTTLLNILMGLLLPDSGEIIGNSNKISAVFQEDRLCETFSSVSNIRMAAGKKVPLKTIEQHLSLLGLADSMYIPVCELSGGMKRRTAIARCILADSELIILDEPFKGLDVENRQKSAKYILENQNARTVIMVSHDVSEAKLMNAQIILLS